jgi:hypothetical protein
MSTDSFDLSAAQIVNAPDVRQWPVTAALTQISFDGSMTSVAFTKKNGPGRWPDITPKGWDGPLQYTLWLFVKNGDQWVGSGFIQFWNGREGSGSPSDPDVPSVYHKNWFYAERWRPINGHGPIQPGEKIGLMVTSGNARDSAGPFGPSERSNVVVIAATDRGVFDFPVDAPLPAPTPAPSPTPPPTPTSVAAPLKPGTAVTLDTLHADLQTLTALVRKALGVKEERAEGTAADPNPK